MFLQSHITQLFRSRPIYCRSLRWWSSEHVFFFLAGYVRSESNAFSSMKCGLCPRGNEQSGRALRGKIVLALPFSMRSRAAQQDSNAVTTSPDARKSNQVG